MRSAGQIVDLSGGQPDFPTPAHVKEAGHRAIDDNFTRYTPQPGFDDLREAIARKLKKDNALDVSPEQVVVSCGAKHSLYNVMNCVLQPGDEAIVLRPYWFAYPAQIRLAGGVPVFVPTRERDGFQPDPDAVRAAITDATRLLIINSPCNPTGAVYRRDILSRLAELAVKRDLFMVTDEVYETILFEGAQHVSVGSLGPEIASRTITINSVSKTHSMTGWRIGYAALPVELAEKVTRLQSVSTSGPCAIAQRAALAALEEPSSHVHAMVTEYAARREYLLRRLAGMDGLAYSPPQGTFYVFLNISGLIGRTLRGHPVRNSDEFAESLANETGVKVASGTPFGSDRHVRICFATSTEVLEQGMDRIERFIAS